MRSLILLALLSTAAHAQRTWSFLTTGNGHGFQVYDTNKNKIISFLDHPYRYTGPRPDPKSDGYGRRNLAFDVYFGLKGGWLNTPSAQGDVSYIDESNIILSKATLGSTQTESYFFSPFGVEANVLVAVLKAPGASDGFALFNFHMGAASNPDQPDANGESLRYVTASQAVVETGPGGGAMVYVPLGGVDHADCAGVFDKVKNSSDLADNTSCAGNDIVPAFQRKLGADGMMAVAMVFVENAADADSAAAAIKSWAGARGPQQILDDSKSEFESWRKAPPANVVCSDVERRLWRQSETVLRMGQVREPYTGTRKNNGMMLASLPPGEWHSGWVRDATYAVVALARSGHHAEAKAALDFFLNAAPVGKFKSFVSNQDYRISVVRYFGNGEEEADYSGQPTPNIEIDGWGMFLWAARQYVEASGDTAWLDSNTKLGPKVYDTLISGVGAPLEANLETNGIAKADSSIWEVHDANKKHFAFTTLSAARGLCDLAGIAKRAGKPDQAKYQTLAQKVRTGFLAAVVDSQGSLGGSLEEIQQNRADDGAVVEAFTWNLLTDLQGQTAKATLQMFDRLKVSSGGFKRNDDGQSSYDNNEWILVDLRISNALRRVGKTAESDGYLKTIVDKAAANFFLVPELYNAVPSDGQIGKYTGSIPMVGYGGGAYILTVLDRAGLAEANDCGDGKGVVLASFTCSGGTGPIPDGGVGPGGGDGGPGNGNNPDIPYLPACYCDLHGGHGRFGGLALLLVPMLLMLRRRKRA